jgi:hypothetical protein
MLDEIEVATSNKEMWKVFQEAISWMRQRYGQGKSVHFSVANLPERSLRRSHKT